MAEIITVMRKYGISKEEQYTFDNIFYTAPPHPPYYINYKNLVFV